MFFFSSKDEDDEPVVDEFDDRLKPRKHSVKKDLSRSVSPCPDDRLSPRKTSLDVEDQPKSRKSSIKRVIIVANVVHVNFENLAGRIFNIDRRSFVGQIELDNIDR